MNIERVDNEKARDSLEWSLRGLTAIEIAEEIARKHNCPTPDQRTIYKWLHKFDECILEDIKGYTLHLRHRQHGMIQRIYKRWMPVLEAEALHVQRMRMQDGEMVPVIDEDSYKEQLKATEIVLKAMEREATLMDLDQKKEIEDGQGQLTGELLAAFIRQQIGQSNDSLQNAKPLLEMKSGVEGMDEKLT